jgi:hypothetical protein
MHAKLYPQSQSRGIRMKPDYNATIADRYDIQRTRTQARKTALIWMRVLAIAGLGALLSAVLDVPSIELWIVVRWFGCCNRFVELEIKQF